MKESPTIETQKGFLIKVNTTAEKQYQITKETHSTNKKGHQINGVFKELLDYLTIKTPKHDLM